MRALYARLSHSDAVVRVSTTPDTFGTAERAHSVNSTCTDPGSFHTDDTTVWFRLAYRTPFKLWRVIPHRWMTRPCPAWKAGQ